MELLATRARALRENGKVSQRKIAAAIGVTDQALDNLENGANSKASTITALARYWSVSTDYLLGLTDDPTPAPPREDGVGDAASAEALDRIRQAEAETPQVPEADPPSVPVPGQHSRPRRGGKHTP